MRKLLSVLLVMALCLSVGITFSGKAIKASALTAEAEIVYKDANTPNDIGLIASTPKDWVANERTDFSIDVENKDIEWNYYAIDFKVSPANPYEYFVVKFGFNGAEFASGEAAADGVGGNTHTAVSHKGVAMKVNQKYSYWFFVPRGFDGVLYIEKSYCGTAGETVEAINSLLVLLDSMFTNRSSSVCWRSFFLAKELGDQMTTENKLIDCLELETANKNTVTDYRFSSKALTFEMADGEDVVEGEPQFLGVKINTSLINAVMFGQKRPSHGGVEITDPYEYNWAEIKLSAPFEAKDGLALNCMSLAATNLMRIYLMDENGALWSPIVGGGKNYTSILEDGSVSYVGGTDNCLQISKDTIGTVYMPYESFTNVTAGVSFMGVDMPAATKMGNISKIYLGFKQSGWNTSSDWYDPMGIIVGAIGNVDLTANTVDLVVNTAKLTDEQVDFENVVGAEGAVISNASSEAHMTNWDVNRMAEEYFPGYVNKTTLRNLILACKRLNKDEYTSQSWSNLQAKVLIAEVVLNSDFSDADDIKKAREDLSVAKFALERLDDQPSSERPVPACSSSVTSVFPAVFFIGAALIALNKKRGTQK